MTAKLTFGNFFATFISAACVWPPMPMTSLFFCASVVSACSMSALLMFSIICTLILSPSAFCTAVRPS